MKERKINCFSLETRIRITVNETERQKLKKNKHFKIKNEHHEAKKILKQTRNTKKKIL